MRLCPVRELEEGVVLGKSIYQANGRLLLGAGFRISEDVKSRLVEKGYSHVYIAEEGTEEIIPEDVISDTLRQQAQSRLADKVGEIRNLARFQEMTYSKARDLIEQGYLQKVSISADMRQTVMEILEEISASGAKFQNSILFKSKDTYFFDHAVNVTTLAILIGMRFRYTRLELARLALGSFLHDIGKIIIEQLRREPDASDRNLYREHPTFGYLLLRSSPDINSTEIQVVNQHHEHQDGSGFPIGLRGENLPPIRSMPRKRGSIFRFAEICCVASAYDNLVMNPLDGVRKTPEEALSLLIRDAGKVYNRTIVAALHEIIPAFPVGATVQIEDIIDPALLGYYGVVARINEERLNRPVIVLTMNKDRKHIRPIMLDTSKLNKVMLKLIL